MKNVMNLTPESEISEEELNNLDELDFHKALFLLKTLYKKMLNVLEAFCTGGYFNVRNETLNFYYVLFKETINQILEIKGFEDLKKETPELFDSLIGDIEEADMEWEYGYSQMAYKFLGKIENLYIKSGTKSFKLPQVLENKLKENDNAIASHIEYEKKLWGKTEQSLDKMKKDFDWGDSSKKVNQAEVPKNIPKTFKIQVKDRYIWVNDFLLSKPHATGSNLEFFEYIRSKPTSTKIERNSLPSQFGSLSLKEQVKSKSFIKILNELGFKSEILKAFFPKRGKNTLVYRGDKITKEDLGRAGVKIPLFLKELELAHLKNNPD